MSNVFDLKFATFPKIQLNTQSLVTHKHITISFRDKDLKREAVAAPTWIRALRLFLGGPVHSVIGLLAVVV